MLHFRVCNILKSLLKTLVLIPYFAYLFTAMLCDDTIILLSHIMFMRNVFCFNCFNQTANILRYSANIKPRKTIKPLKQKTFHYNTVWHKCRHKARLWISKRGISTKLFWVTFKMLHVRCDVLVCTEDGERGAWDVDTARCRSIQLLIWRLLQATFHNYWDFCAGLLFVGFFS